MNSSNNIPPPPNPLLAPRLLLAFSTANRPVPLSHISNVATGYGIGEEAFARPLHNFVFLHHYEFFFREVQDELLGVKFLQVYVCIYVYV